MRPAYDEIMDALNELLNHHRVVSRGSIYDDWAFSVDSMGFSANTKTTRLLIRTGKIESDDDGETRRVIGKWSG